MAFKEQVLICVLIGLLLSATETSHAQSSGSNCTSAQNGVVAGPSDDGYIIKCNGTTWQTITSTGGGDRIVSGSAAVVVGHGGTISLTTGGVSGTAYFDAAGRLVAPGGSTTGPISATNGNFSGAVSATTAVAYTGSFGNVNATGTVSAKATS